MTLIYLNGIHLVVLVVSDGPIFGATDPFYLDSVSLGSSAIVKVPEPLWYKFFFFTILKGEPQF